MAANKTKVVLTCTGPDRLTTYNEEINSKIHKNCRRSQENHFKPAMSCHGGIGYGMCAFLEIKTYK